MSLNNIQLKPQMVAGLFGDKLLEINASPAPQVSARPYLGNNAKGIAVVVNHTGYAYLPEAELTFLTTILSACKLGLADIALFNAARMPEGTAAPAIQEICDRVILFGIAPLDFGLPINFPSFQLQSFDKRLYLYAPPLAEVEGDKTVKARLWGSLKSM